MTVTDAQFSGLSGDVVALQTDVTNNSKILLGLPSKADYNNQQAYISQQFNTINASLETAIETQNTLVQYVSNLKQTITEHVSDKVYALSGLGASGVHTA